MKCFAYTAPKMCGKLGCLLLSLTMIGHQHSFASEWESDLKKLETQTPESYSRKVDAIPRDEEISKFSEERLIVLLKSWNPAMRKAVGKEFGRRGVSSIPKVLELSSVSDPDSRAGASFALGVILHYYFKPPRGSGRKVPNEEERQQVIAKYKVVPALVTLAQDPDARVRRSALGGLIKVGSGYPEVTATMLALTMDDDAHIAQEAMIRLEKGFTAQVIEDPKLIQALKKSFDSEFPRGKGHMIRIIRNMPPEKQKQFLPELLSHVKNKPKRDTMFGGSGKKDAMRILAYHGNKELPGVLLEIADHSIRGMNPLQDGLEIMLQYPKEEIKPLLPKIREMQADYLKTIKTNRNKYARRHAQNNYDVIVSFLKQFS